MGYTGMIRALATLFAVFLLFTIGGALITVLLVHPEPTFLPLFSSQRLLEGYLRWRMYLAVGWQYSAYALAVVITYLILLGGISVASNWWEEVR